MRLVLALLFLLGIVLTVYSTSINIKAEEEPLSVKKFRNSLNMRIRQAEGESTPDPRQGVNNIGPNLAVPAKDF